LSALFVDSKYVGFVKNQAIVTQWVSHSSKKNKIYLQRYTWHISALGIFSTIFHNMGKHGAFVKTAAALWAHAKNLLALLAIRCANNSVKSETSAGDANWMFFGGLVLCRYLTCSCYAN